MNGADWTFCTRIAMFLCMGMTDHLGKHLGRARYTAAQGLRSAWYGGQYAVARRRSAGFNRPGEPAFKPQNEYDQTALRKAPVARELRLRDFGSALRRSRAFLNDVANVDRRRVDRDGTEVRQHSSADPKKYPAYYRQNFHYQTDGWLSDESADLYDHQVEALFTGSADAMRRIALAELAKALKGHDQRAFKTLDLACGTGRFMSQILHAFPKLNLTGLDLSPNYIAAAQKHVRRWPQVETIEGQAEALPFADNSFDAIVNVYLFHELPPRVRPKIIEEAARVLKPGGVFIIADSLQFGDNPKLDGILEYFPEGFHEPYYKGYLSWDFAPAMEAAGFAPKDTHLAFLTKVRTWRKRKD